MRRVEGTAMNSVMVWMALLLDGFKLEKQGDFHKAATLVAYGAKQRLFLALINLDLKNSLRENNSLIYWAYSWAAIL